MQRETAEAADLDLVALLEGTDDGLEEGVDDDFAVTTGEITERGYLVDEVGFGHL